MKDNHTYSLENFNTVWKNGPEQLGQIVKSANKILFEEAFRTHNWRLQESYIPGLHFLLESK